MPPLIQVSLYGLSAIGVVIGLGAVATVHGPRILSFWKATKPIKRGRDERSYGDWPADPRTFNDTTITQFAPVHGGDHSRA